MLAVVQQAADCVLSLFLIGLVGYVLDKKGWFSPDTKALLPRLVTMVTLPFYMFSNIIRTFSHDQLAQLVYGVIIPASSIVLTFGLSILVAKITKVRRERLGLFTVSSAASNTIFIGLPVNVALFGEAALPYVLLYFFANTSFFWTIGNYCLSLDGDRQPEKIWSKNNLKRIFSPPLIGFILGVLAVVLEIIPPRFFMSAAGYVGSLTMPLAIIFIGITIASVKLRSLTPDLDTWLLLAFRFLISPLVIIGLIQLIEIPPLMAKVFVIQSSLPVISSAVLLAGYYRSDATYASVIVTLSTLMSLLTIPMFMIILTLLFPGS